MDKFEKAQDQAADYLVTEDGKQRAADTADHLTQPDPEQPEDVNRAFKGEDKRLADDSDSGTDLDLPTSDAVEEGNPIPPMR
ncbi:MAG TPA: hypothetical protein K8V93_08305 [Corynebacterium pollutisoli]|uniref:Uncharacterized protein n=1 Tax=Corynebacterium pollutisoli TaxID=1610489 RepID=A0A7X8MXX0_9CORY|nr:hypothetical protein [Corynebacterium pollutisoli]HJD78997.1 hypothetical protein [Corynebacterium pollutisoli]